MKETFALARFFMILGSLAPFYILLAIKGSCRISELHLWFICVALAIVPNLCIWARIRIAKRRIDKVNATVISYSDNREHLLVYLFTVLVPLYQSDYGTYRELASVGLVFLFVVFLFVHLNLHYMNFLFAIFGYRIFGMVQNPGKLD